MIEESLPGIFFKIAGRLYCLAELLVIKPCIETVFCHQLVVASLLYNFPFSDDGDLVGVFDCGETMRNNEGRPALTEFIERLLDQDFRGIIKRAGGLVQNQDWRVFQKDPRD